MEFFNSFLNEIGWEDLILSSVRILFILIAAWLAVFVIRRLLRQLEQHLHQRYEDHEETNKQVDTVMHLVHQAVMIAFWSVVFLIVLREMGFAIGPILASAGVVGLAVGFGAQNLVRDVISGFFFLLENQVRVGDVAVVNGTGGLVEKMNFRTIVLRDLSGAVHVFPNGTITTLSNLTKGWSAHVFDLGVGYGEDPDRVIDVIKRVGAEMYSEDRWKRLMLGEPEVFGVDKFADSAVMIKGRIKTRPIKQWDVGREFLRRIKHAFNREGIEIPFPQRTLNLGRNGSQSDMEALTRLAATD